jgi:hypothetical protein
MADFEDVKLTAIISITLIYIITIALQKLEVATLSTLLSAVIGSITGIITYNVATERVKRKILGKRGCIYWLFMIILIIVLIVLLLAIPIVLMLGVNNFVNSLVKSKV